MSEDDAPRLAPLPREEWDEEVRAAIAAGFGPDAAARLFSDDPDTPRLPNALATMAHHPALTGPWLAYNNVLLGSPSLAPRVRELIVLRVAWTTGSRYEWVQHVRIARALGITGEEIEAIAGLRDTMVWPELEDAVLAATDQLLDQFRIDDATWSRLADHLDERQLVEVVFVAGTYTCLAMAFKTFGIALDPELDAVPAPAMPQGPE